MKKAIFAFSKGENPIVLKARKTNGWKFISTEEATAYLRKAKDIVYLGSCKQDGDMFAVHGSDGYVRIFKGELNSGMY
jgi:hypothetical protein